MSKITKQKKALKKINQILPKVTFINVIDDEHTEVTVEGNPDDRWSRDSTSTSHYIRGIQIHPSYGEVECSFEVERGIDYYLLYYTYGTGDSFGSDSGKIEFVALYNDEELAQKSFKALDKAGSNGDNKVTIWNDLGQPYDEYVNQDYFGGFESAYLEPVHLI